MPTTYAIPNGRTVMDATTYSGAGNVSTSITNQFGFKPDLVWTKARSTTYNNILYDSVRGTGTTKSLYSDDTAAEGAYSTFTNLSSFNSNGWTIGTTAGNNAMNASGQNFVAWQWQAGQGTTSSNTQGSITSTVSANTTAGFSIVSYTTQSSGTGTVGHGLGAAPSLIILKNTALNNNWIVYHTSLGASAYLYLNTTAASVSDSSVFNGTNPTSTVFSMGTGLAGSISTIAYCWAQVAGYSAFGSYTGNGSTDGPFIYTGFRPKLVIYKKSTGLGSWFMFDSTRNPYNSTNLWLQANTNEAEQTDGSIDILSNGFKQRASGGGSNTNGDTFVYMAWAENPFKYATAR